MVQVRIGSRDTKRERQREQDEAVAVTQCIATVMTNVYADVQWARITRKLAKILTLLVLFETHIVNKTKTKISNVFKKNSMKRTVQRKN